MTTRLPWWKKHVSDWRAGTRGMSLEMRGFYGECLDAQWDVQRQLPLDPKKLAIMLGCNPRSVRKLMPELVAMGKMIQTATGYYNPRMMRDILDTDELPTGHEFEPVPELVSRRIEVEYASNSTGIQPEFDPKVPKNPDNSTRVFKIPDTRVRDKEERADACEVDSQPKAFRKSTQRGTRLDPNWQLPDDWRMWARTIFPASTDASVAEQAACFRDYWIAKPGAQACKLDWEATWRNWCRRGLSAAGSVRQPQHTGVFGRSAEPPRFHLSAAEYARREAEKLGVAA
jgi:uncharacterized protein YdaU (DUF1376 family)